MVKGVSRYLYSAALFTFLAVLWIFCSKMLVGYVNESDSPMRFVIHMVGVMLFFGVVRRVKISFGSDKIINTIGNICFIGVTVAAALTIY
ncbi:hypothetical protein [Paenibacillus sp. OAE614]|uniref:hypothetical protein n=1 Tax=Paenibacillus sp. OAE614 TaxID=2663804 RepID=UPI00178BCF40